MTQELFRTAFIDGKAGPAPARWASCSPIVTLVFASIVFTVNRLLGGKDRIVTGMTRP